MKKTLLTILVIIIVSCTNIKVVDELPNSYVVLRNNEVNGFNISYSIENGDFVELIPSNIIEVGYNDSFIIVKQNPYLDSPEYKEINYYIIPLKDKTSNFPDENKIGPLSENEFILKKETFQISDKLTFFKKY